MKTKAIYAAAVLTIAILFGAPTTASAQEPAHDAWDRKINQGANRFVVLQRFNSEAVTDLETGLVWEREPSSTLMNWQAAQVHCTRLVKGGRGGWRLPTIQELTSLTTVPPPNSGDPLPLPLPLPTGHPFVFVPSVLGFVADHWSATSSETIDPAGRAWLFGVTDGAIFHREKSFDLESAWCVRFRQG